MLAGTRIYFKSFYANLEKMKIWQRHLLEKLVKTFFFFLFCLICIYVVIDLSAHGVRFLSKSSFSEIALFYLNTFATLLDLFFTLTFLLASMRVLFSLNHHRELVALQMAGLSKKRLLLPFFIFAGALSFISYLNEQFFYSSAQEVASNFKTAHKSKQKIKPAQEKLFTLPLEDESELIYRKFNKDKKELVDVFWVRGPADIWHMKTLHIDSLRGDYVNHLTRGTSNLMEKQESFERKIFSEIPWNDEAILNRFISYESRSISTLAMQALSSPADGRIICSHLYYKLIAPLMPFLALFAIGPLALNYTRKRQTFLITTTFIFAFIALKIIMDGMLILGENQVLPAFVAIFSPFICILIYTIPRFIRLK